MRFLYFLFKILLHYPFRLFFSKIKFINPNKAFFGRTIIVANHASSFLDPLIIALMQNPIIFFMTRSDVFKTWLKPVLWSVHMLPIYREQDGKDTKAKNIEVFKKCAKILKNGRSLLLFGEGFTDDVFVRRLKPVKKGAARIGFDALVSLNWSKKIYMNAVGLNYGDPNYFGSELLISTSEKFCLNDYKELYEVNPSKTIVEVTKKIETLLQEQLTHVENVNLVFFHEHVSRILRNGLHPIDSDKSIPLKVRFQNSKDLAKWINEGNFEEEKLNSLKEDLNLYFASLKKFKISDDVIYKHEKKGQNMFLKEKIYIWTLFPFAFLGFIQFFLPYRFVKNFAEKKFKRKVFWSSIKIMMGSAIISLFSIPIFIILNYFLIHDFYISLVAYFCSPVIGLIAYYWFRKVQKIRNFKNIRQQDLGELIEERNHLLKKVKLMYPLRTNI
jgi:1-acyl-sn-glycerol-3-phosphate acyltransferase